MSKSIFVAIENGDISGIKSAIEADPSVLNTRDKRTGNTPLTYAINRNLMPIFTHYTRSIHREKLLEIATVLIEAGADVNAPNASSNSPLCIVAALTDAIELAELLIKHGADVNAKNSDGFTPLILTFIMNKAANAPDIARLLVENGADIQQVIDFISHEPNESKRKMYGKKIAKAVGHLKSIVPNAAYNRRKTALAAWSGWSGEAPYYGNDKKSRRMGKGRKGHKERKERKARKTRKSKRGEY